MATYTIGIDYGTLSARAVVADTSDGRVLAAGEFPYPHGVMSRQLPTGEPLPPGWALQDPQDYLEALEHAVREAVQQSGVNPAEIVGMGVDFTSSTTLPVTADGTPLCMQERFRREKHAWVKLWKHHGAKTQTGQINRVVAQRQPAWMQYYGGRFNSEWPLPKLLEVLQEAPEVYDAMDVWVEAGDWVVWQLTGSLKRSEGMASVKEQYDSQTGCYPEEDFLRAVDARLLPCYQARRRERPLPLGSCAGHLTPQMAARLGLTTDTAVAVANIDGHVGAVVTGMEHPGQFLAMLGTSSCWFALSPGGERLAIPGVCCGAEDIIWPGLVGYESGQSAVGDMYQAFVDRFVPAAYADAAQRRGQPLQQYLTELAAEIAPGESGLLMLDWVNGNRSPLADVDLTGLLVGLTLKTRPEEIYRAMLEASAFGARVIVDNYTKGGIARECVIASGGISRKNPLAMQIYADVLQLPVHVAGSAQGPAHGAALFGAVAAGCFPTVQAAAQAMKQPYLCSYQPDPARGAIYQRLYEQYVRLMEIFRQQGSVMKELLEIRQPAAQRASAKAEHESGKGGIS